MNEIIAIGAINEAGAVSMPVPARGIQSLSDISTNALISSPQASRDFSSIITEGLSRMDAKVAHADKMVTQFAIDDNTPIHHVTIALEEARLSVELAMQVRQRVVEGYRELMNLQL